MPMRWARSTTCLGPDLEHELGVGGVRRHPGGVDEVEHALLGAAVVADPPVRRRGSRARCRPGASKRELSEMSSLHGGGQHERLHGRARLAPDAAAAGGEVELVGVEVARRRTWPGRSRSGRRRRGRPAGSSSRVEGLVHGVVGRLLGVVVEGRVHPQAAAVDLVVGEAELLQLLADVLDEVLGAVLRAPRPRRGPGARAGRRSCRPRPTARRRRRRSAAWSM